MARKPTLEQLVHEILPFVSTRLKTRISVEQTDNDEIWVISEEHKADGSYDDAEVFKFRLVND
jgi:hypothetical protein